MARIGEHEEVQQDNTLAAYMIKDRIKRLKKELESSIDKRDRSYDNAVMANKKGISELYIYWRSQHVHHAEHTKEIRDELSKLLASDK